MQAEPFDPSIIEEETIRLLVIELMNQVEKLSAQVGELKAENQRLRDEISRLKGEQGKPKIAGNTKASTNHSSEQERRKPRPHHKESKQATLHIDREKVLTLDPSQLPEDAQFKGYEEVVIQDIEFRTDNVKFRREKYYSPSLKRTYLAPLPTGYHGQFGPKLRAWVLALYFEGGMSEPKILEVLETVGISLSAGQLSDLLIHEAEVFHAEKAEIVQAGLESSAWQHLDSTATRVNGHNHNCHVLCNPLYTAYTTLPAKDRRSMLRVRHRGADPTFRWNSLARELLDHLGVSQKWSDALSPLLRENQDLTEKELDVVLEKHLPKLGEISCRRLKEALSIAFYRTQTDYPTVGLLVVDDAPQFECLTVLLALCWIHEFRHYKKLIPRFAHHLTLLADFGKAFWKLYHALLAYREHPTESDRAALTTQFDSLFTKKTDYEQLDSCKARTFAKREQLLVVLSHPDIPLHNNPAELGVRFRVRKRDVSEASLALLMALLPGIPFKPWLPQPRSLGSISSSICMIAWLISTLFPV
jgi:hypothetical protein